MNKIVKICSIQLTDVFCIRSYKLHREDIFEPTIENESLYEISNDNGVRVVNFITSKNLNVKTTMFPHHNIHKFTCTLSDGNVIKFTIF
jgi:hypothetical protein